jgi:hypothetical protein
MSDVEVRACANCGARYVAAYGHARCINQKKAKPNRTIVDDVLGPQKPSRARLRVVAGAEAEH